VGQHPGIFKSTQFENHKKGWVNITGMVGQHETERWVNMKRNLQFTVQKDYPKNCIPFRKMQLQQTF